MGVIQDYRVNLAANLERLDGALMLLHTESPASAAAGGAGSAAPPPTCTDHALGGSCTGHHAPTTSASAAAPPPAPSSSFLVSFDGNMRKIEWLHQTGIAARAMSLSYQAFAAASGQLIDEDVLKAFLMAELRANAKIRGIVKNLHSRVIAFLCTHEVVLLPWFRISNMVSKETSVLTASTKRVGLSQSHYMFKQRLINKAVETGTKVIFVDERFTSRTCPRCWTWHKNLGGGKVFICPRPGCGY